MYFKEQLSVAACDELLQFANGKIDTLLKLKPNTKFKKQNTQRKINSEKRGQTAVCINSIIYE